MTYNQELTLFEVDPIVPTPGGRRKKGRRRTATPDASTAVATVIAGAPPAQDVGVADHQRPLWPELPPTLDVVSAGTLLGVGRTLAYRLVRQGKWPTHVVRAGGKIMIPTVPLLEFLGITESELPRVLALSTGSPIGLDPLVNAGGRLRPPVERR
jgi:hypothetical protein